MPILSKALNHIKCKALSFLYKMAQKDRTFIDVMYRKILVDLELIWIIYDSLTIFPVIRSMVIARRFTRFPSLAISFSIASSVG